MAVFATVHCIRLDYRKPTAGSREPKLTMPLQCTVCAADVAIV